jgi:hypothetical protein
MLFILLLSSVLGIATYMQTAREIDYGYEGVLTKVSGEG